MANDDHITQLKNGVNAWNVWRDENRNIHPNLRGADLTFEYLKEANLSGADLSEVNLGGANLSGADLSRADLKKANLTVANLSASKLSGANLSAAKLSRADLRRTDLRDAILGGANLNGANLSGANLYGANLSEVNVGEANLSGARLVLANLSGANLSGADLSAARLVLANLSGADLSGAHLYGADLSRANLSGANLQAAALVSTDLSGADLTGCLIYGVSAWRPKLDTKTKQQNLLITHPNETPVTVDNIEVAQFIYLMLRNQKIRDVIDTMTSKAVLILGRFTDERKVILDALREELRKHNYLPILVDFGVPATQDLTETVSLLARMARFIIAELTDPSSIPKELEAIVPRLAVPVQPLLEGSTRPYAMFKDYWKYEWVLPVYRYEVLERLLATLAEKVIAPAEGKVKALEERRRMIEAELTKPQ